MRFVDGDGKRRRLSTGLPDSVPEEQARVQAATKVRAAAGVASPLLSRAVGTVLNVAEALERCYIGRWSNNASGPHLKYVVRMMEREVGHWLLSDMPGPIGYQKIKDYRDGILRDGKSKATANRRMSLLRVALREALKEGHLGAMPVFPEQLDEENVTERFLSQDEEVKALEWIKGKSLAEQYDPESTGEWTYMRLLVIGLLDTGARLSELLKLKECNSTEVVFKGAVAVEQPSVVTGRRRSKKNTKSGKSRRVPLTERAATALPALIAHPLHGTVSVDWCGYRWQQVRDAHAEIADVNLHLLRHTFACRLLEAGVDLFVVSKLLGHSSVQVTERYGHLARTSGVFEQAISALSRKPVVVSSAAKKGVA